MNLKASRLSNSHNPDQHGRGAEYRQMTPNRKKQYIPEVDDEVEMSTSPPFTGIVIDISQRLETAEVLYRPEPKKYRRQWLNWSELKLKERP